MWTTKLTAALKACLPALFRIVFLAVLCGVMIGPALGGEFLQWDDDKNLYKNNWLLDGQVGMFWTQKYYFLLYIPLTYTIWTGLWHLWGDPLAFHIFSLALHVLNCNWVFLIVRRLFPVRLKTSGAWLVMVAFAVMPLQVEAFAWISGGRDVMALQFALAAVYLFVIAESRWTLAASALVFALGLLCKPTIAPLPVALLAFFPVRSLMRRRQWITLGIWLLLAIVDLAWNRWVQDIGMDAKVLYPFEDRLLLCIDILGFYISKIVFPWHLKRRLRENSVESHQPTALLVHVPRRCRRRSLFCLYTKEVAHRELGIRLFLFGRNVARLGSDSVYGSGRNRLLRIATFTGRGSVLQFCSFSSPRSFVTAIKLSRFFSAFGPAYRLREASHGLPTKFSLRTWSQNLPIVLPPTTHSELSHFRITVLMRPNSDLKKHLS